MEHKPSAPQLALSVFWDPLAAGKCPLYVCFSRPLADHFERISPTFTGKYDLAVTPIYSEGYILLDLVYRFKGQAVPCTVFTEIDFEEVDKIATNKIFVGSTRASMKLFLVISEKAVQQLIVKNG